MEVQAAQARLEARVVALAAWAAPVVLVPRAPVAEHRQESHQSTIQGCERGSRSCELWYGVGRGTESVGLFGLRRNQEVVVDTDQRVGSIPISAWDRDRPTHHELTSSAICSEENVGG